MIGDAATVHGWVCLVCQQQSCSFKILKHFKLKTKKEKGIFQTFLLEWNSCLFLFFLSFFLNYKTFLAVHHIAELTESHH